MVLEMYFALLLACHPHPSDTSGGGESTPVSDSESDPETDAESGNGGDTSQHTGDTSTGNDSSDSGDDTSQHTGGESGAGPVAIGGECEPNVDTCADGGMCCTPCCASEASPVCSVPGRDGACPLPDLTVDERRASGEMRIDTMTFAADSCAVLEGCVGAAGTRKLLRFTTVTPNEGDADLTLGVPAEDTEGFEWSTCHGHYHYSGYMQVDLASADGIVAVNQKQAFCLMDSEPWGSPTGGPYFTCGNQGITAGWADTYSADLDCQWVDITDVAPGDYELELIVDPFDHFTEIDELNNTVRFAVTIPA